MDTVFFLLSKVVGFGLKVEVWLLGLALIALIDNVRAKRVLACRASAVLVALFVGLGVLPVGDLLLAPLETVFPVQQTLSDVDGIIVLGGGEDVLASVQAGQAQVSAGGDRYIAAIALARAHPRARLVFTGGSGRLRDLNGALLSEAAVARQIFAGQGIASERLLFEGAARNTAENARASYAMVKPQPDEKWVLVTSAFHMPRAIRSFEAVGWTEILPVPVDFRTRERSLSIGWDFQRNLTLTNLALREWVGRFVYRATAR